MFAFGEDSRALRLSCKPADLRAVKPNLRCCKATTKLENATHKHKEKGRRKGVLFFMVEVTRRRGAPIRCAKSCGLALQAIYGLPCAACGCAISNGHLAQGAKKAARLGDLALWSR